MQIKPADADRFLARPDPAVRLLLIYGNDDGLVSERTTAFAKAVVGTADDPFAVVRLDPATLSEDPRRLADEAHAISMFGGRRCIIIRLSGNWSVVPALEPLFATPPVDSWIVVAAGELKKTSAVRRLFEAGKGAAALPCYADSGRDLERIIDEETRAAGVTMTTEARTLLRSLIGGDRMASRAEVSKLCLYAGPGGTVGIEDVRAIVGDASAFAVDETVDAAAGGDTASLARLYRRLIAAGTGDFTIAGAALRHFDALHRGRALFDQGADAESAVGPQVFFSRRAAVARQIAAWPLGRIERALSILDRAIVDSRLNAGLSEEIVGQAMLSIAAMAAAMRRR